MVKEILHYHKWRGESRFVRHIPTLFVLINVILSLPLLVFEIFALDRGIRLGDSLDWPTLVIFCFDFPGSIIALAWANILVDYKIIDMNSVLVANLAYSIFLLLWGGLQYYFVGILVRRRIRRRRVG